jgi:hypothetical protein
MLLHSAGAIVAPSCLREALNVGQPALPPWPCHGSSELMQGLRRNVHHRRLTAHCCRRLYLQLVEEFCQATRQRTPLPGSPWPKLPEASGVTGVPRCSLTHVLLEIVCRLWLFAHRSIDCSITTMEVGDALAHGDELAESGCARRCCDCE